MRIDKSALQMTKKHNTNCGKPFENDKWYQSIIEKITQAMKAIKSKNIDIKKIEKMNSLQANNILKSKDASMRKRRKRVKPNSAQGIMEDYTIKYIKKIRKNKKSVTTLIVFRKVAELYPTLNGEITPKKYMTDMKNCFYYGFNKRFNLSQ